jgi:hypothetical protein
MIVRLEELGAVDAVIFVGRWRGQIQSKGQPQAELHLAHIRCIPDLSEQRGR